MSALELASLVLVLLLLLLLLRPERKEDGLMLDGRRNDGRTDGPGRGGSGEHGTHAHAQTQTETRGATFYAVGCGFFSFFLFSSPSVFSHPVVPCLHRQLGVVGAIRDNGIVCLRAPRRHSKYRESKARPGSPFDRSISWRMMMTRQATDGAGGRGRGGRGEVGISLVSDGARGEGP